MPSRPTQRREGAPEPHGRRLASVQKHRSTLVLGLFLLVAAVLAVIQRGGPSPASSVVFDSGAPTAGVGFRGARVSRTEPLAVDDISAVGRAGRDRRSLGCIDGDAAAAQSVGVGGADPVAIADAVRPAGAGLGRISTRSRLRHSRQIP